MPLFCTITLSNILSSLSLNVSFSLMLAFIHSFRPTVISYVFEYTVHLIYKFKNSVNKIQPRLHFWLIQFVA